VTAEQFRKLTLEFPETAESAHMNHPDFRVRRKFFCHTPLSDHGWGMVKLTPEPQEEFVQAEPDVFKPVNGPWGRGGATNVRLKSAKKPSVQRALTASRCNAASKALARQFETEL
jgi:hypothetical protein